MDSGPVMTDLSSVFLNKMMALTQERQRTISNNLANANTPNYVRRDIQFEDQLSRLVAEKQIDQIRNFQSTQVEDVSETPRLDGNNVKVPNEMNRMMQNGLLYSLLAKSFTTRLNIMRSAIQ